MFGVADSPRECWPLTPPATAKGDSGFVIRASFVIGSFGIRHYQLGIRKPRRAPAPTFGPGRFDVGKPLPCAGAIVTASESGATGF